MVDAPYIDSLAEALNSKVPWFVVQLAVEFFTAPSLLTKAPPLFFAKLLNSP